MVLFACFSSSRSRAISTINHCLSSRPPYLSNSKTISHHIIVIAAIHSSSISKPADLATGDCAAWPRCGIDCDLASSLNASSSASGGDHPLPYNEAHARRTPTRTVLHPHHRRMRWQSLAVFAYKERLPRGIGIIDYRPPPLDAYPHAIAALRSIALSNDELAGNGMRSDWSPKSRLAAVCTDRDWRPSARGRDGNVRGNVCLAV